MHAQNLPENNESEAAENASTNPTSRKRLDTNSIITKLLKKVMKTKPPQTIHSGTINEDEHHSALAPFTMTGIDVGRVNRNYDAFFKTAWGSSPTSTPTTSTANPPQPSLSSAQALGPPYSQAEKEDKEEEVGCHNIIELISELKFSLIYNE